MKHLVIGFGDVGRGLYDILQKYNPVAIDKGTNLKGQFDVLHICFPYSEGFIESVCNYACEYQPELIIIHSTVAVGTTRAIKVCDAVHSPVRGRHPSMARDMKTYMKYFGGIQAEKAAKIFQAVGMRTKCFDKPEATELGKLLSNIRWGLNIAFAQEQQRMCEHYGVKYEDVVNEFEHTRNVGLRQINRDKVTMPIIFPGIIGGHCVMPNVDILYAGFVSPFLKVILDSNRKYKDGI